MPVIIVVVGFGLALVGAAIYFPVLATARSVLARRSKAAQICLWIGFIVVAVSLGVLFEWWVGAAFFAIGAVAVIHELAEQGKLDRGLECIQLHARELARKRRRLVMRDGYGVVDASKWEAEVSYFLDKVVAPTAGAVAVLSRTWTELRDAIEAAAAADAGVLPTFSADMPPLEYEVLVAQVLKDMGWDARTTKGSGDQGVDVLAVRDGIRLVVQCKLYGKPVGNAAVQEAIAGRAFEEATHAAVVSNAEYTRAAKQLAQSARVLLLHHEDLLDLDQWLFKQTGRLSSESRIDTLQ